MEESKRGRQELKAEYFKYDKEEKDTSPNQRGLRDKRKRLGGRKKMGKQIVYKTQSFNCSFTNEVH